MKKEKLENPIGVSIDAMQAKVDYLPELPVDLSAKHPTPELLLIREAVKYLTPKQRKVWEYHAYDKLTQEEISQKLNISRPVVSKHIKAAEKRIARWCKSNMGAYELLKSDFERIE